MMTLTSDMIINEGGWMELTLNEVAALLTRVVEHPIPQGAQCARPATRVCPVCNTLYRPQPRPLLGPAPVSHVCRATHEVRTAEVAATIAARADAQHQLLCLVYGLSTSYADLACADLLLRTA